MNKIKDIKLRKINEDESELEYLNYLKEKCFEFSKPSPRDREISEANIEYNSYLENYYNDFYRRLDLLTEIVPLLADYETVREERKRIKKENNIYKPSLIQRFHANKIVRKTKKIVKAVKRSINKIEVVSKKVVSNIKLIPNKISKLSIKIGKGIVKNSKLGINKVTKFIKKPLISFVSKRKENKRLNEEFIELIRKEKTKDILNSLEEEVIEEENDILDELYEEEYEREDNNKEDSILDRLYEEKYDLEDKIIKTTEKDLLNLEEEIIEDKNAKKLFLRR